MDTRTSPGPAGLPPGHQGPKQAIRPLRPLTTSHTDNTLCLSLSLYRHQGEYSISSGGIGEVHPEVYLANYPKWVDLVISRSHTYTTTWLQGAPEGTLLVDKHTQAVPSGSRKDM